MISVSDDFKEYIYVNPPKEQLCKNIIDPKNLPLVSFCIPTKNNEKTIEKCLLSIVTQDYPHIEIIIVDGGSLDKTIPISEKYTEKIYYEQGNLGIARQRSIDAAHGKIIALFDSDIVIPHNKWLINAVMYFNYSERISTIWPQNIAPPNSPRMTRLYFNVWKCIIENRITTGRGIFGGGNSLFLRNSLNEIGEIDRNLHWGEDFDLALKLKNHGFSVVYIFDPLYHDTMKTLKEFYRKQFTGAQTFVHEGFGLMGLSLKDVIYEQIIIGFSGMIKGILIRRDFSWLLFPFMLCARIFAYFYTKVTEKLKK